MTQDSLRRAASFFISDVGLDISGLADTLRSQTQIVWAWNAIDGIDGYQYAVRAENGTWGVTQTIAATTATVTGLLAGFTYEIRVRAFVGGLFGDYAYDTAATVLPAPGAPSNLHVDFRFINGIAFDWTTGVFATSYDTAYRRVGEISWSATLNIVLSQRYVTRLDPDTEYEFRVRSRNSSGTSSYITISSSTNVPPIPGAPRSLTSQWISSQIYVRITWMPPSVHASSVTGYERRYVYRVIDTGELIIGDRWFDLGNVLTVDIEIGLGFSDVRIAFDVRAVSPYGHGPYARTPYVDGR